jgi:Histidine kinase
LSQRARLLALALANWHDFPFFMTPVSAIASPARLAPDSPPNGLLQRWVTLHGALQMSAIQLAFVLAVVVSIRLLSGTAPLRFGGLEVVLFVVASGAVGVIVHAIVLRCKHDFRLAWAASAYLGSALTFLVFAALLADATPALRMPVDGRLRHPLDSMLLACMLIMVFAMLFLVYEETRLTALNPLRALKSKTSLVTPESGLLDQWTLKHLFGHTFEETVTWFFVGVGLGIVARQLPIEPKPAYGDWMDRLLPGDSALWLVAFFFFSHSGVCFARKVPWLQHSMAAVIALLSIDHLVTFAVICFVASKLNPQIGLGFFIVVGTIATISLVTSVIAFNRRAEFISTARHAQAVQREATLAAERARTVAELAALQAQIEPHFLYNTLTNLQLLIRQEAPSPSRSDAMITHLIDYLRARVPLVRASTTTVSQEFELVRNYLAIIQVRMGKRLHYEVALPDGLANATLPPLSVVTLVENSIKHGLEPKRGGGEIHVQAIDKPAEGVMEILVVDTGVGFVAGIAGAGIGLTNIRERLELSYGADAALTLTANSPSGVIATLRIPHVNPAT